MAIDIRNPGLRMMPQVVQAPGQKNAESRRQTAHDGVRQQSVRQQIDRQGHQPVQGNPEDCAVQEDRSIGMQLQDAVDASGGMAALMSSRNRRDFDKKTDQSGGGFERVLEEDAQPKAQKIIKIAGTQGISVDELLRRARSLFPDVSDLIVVLRELLRRRQMDQVMRLRLQQALAQAERDAPPKGYKAGINIALKARLFGAKLALSASLLRASYRNFLESEEAEIVIYEEWIVSYGHARRALVTEFLESALVADMLAQDPSCSRIEFGNLLGRLNQLKLLRSSETLFIDALLGEPAVTQHNGVEADWLVFMLAVLQAPEELDGLLADIVGEQLLLSSHAARSGFLQAVRQACHALPPTLFIDADALTGLLERFAELASLAYRHELIDMRRRHAGDNRRVLAKTDTEAGDAQ